MFKKNTVKAFSIVAIVLSSIGLLACVLNIWFYKGDLLTILSFLGIVSWSILLWASIIGFKLCVSYNLYEDEYKKVGIRIYLIIAAFVLFLFVGLILGLPLSVILLSTLWGLKRNYDEWNGNNSYTIAPDISDKP
ncbi:hypothetical protein QEG73_19360 [Chitinophagaceae bacterium 26-R-25]|nr:hypothetical protein [Chitinophagaceae bacterium 26-R-25]